jgi:hypothetical protein
METLTIMRSKLFMVDDLDEGTLNDIKSNFKGKKIIISVPDDDFENIQEDVKSFIYASISIEQTLTDKNNNRYYITTTKNYNKDSDTDLKGHGGGGSGTGQGDGKGHGGSGSGTGQGKGHGGSGSGTGQGDLNITVINN